MHTGALSHEGDSEKVTLRDMTLVLPLAVGGTAVVVAGVAQLATGPAFGVSFLLVGAFWALAALRSFVVVDDAGVQVRDVWRTRRVASRDIVGLEVHELGFFEGRGKSVLRIRLASGGSVDVHEGLIPIGPSRFHGRVANVIAERMRACGLTVTVPNEVRFL